MIVGPCIALAALGLAGGIVGGRRWPRVWLALTLMAATGGLGAALVLLAGGADWVWRSALPVGGEVIHLRLDGVSAVFLALMSVVGGAGAVYSREYWSDREQRRSAGRGRRWWSGLMASMGWVLLSANGLHFLLGWEAFTVCAFFLVTLDGRMKAVRRAGWLYLAASHAGTVCLFAFFALLAHSVGSWELGPMREHVELAPLFWLVLAGFGVKAGLFPLHVWLPSAHANAPSHVSAILSGVAIKMGVYGLVRFSGWLPVPAAAGWVVIVAGMVSAVLGIAFALAQDDLKRLLAYCSVENIGVILIGLGAAMLGAAHGGNGLQWGRLALAGALLHVWNHGAFKALLFFSAGSVLHATGTREMSRLGGLWRAMPWTAGAFALGSVAVAALPPLNGFVSEWLIYLGLFDAVTTQGPAAAVAVPAAIVLGVAGALALATFIKAGTIVFMGAARTRRPAHAHECGVLMRGAMCGLAAICLGLGLAPQLLRPILLRATAAWHPAWGGVDPGAPLVPLGTASLAVAMALAVGVVLVFAHVRRNGLNRSVTWDCGYATPGARMQYTSGSFGDLAARWFRWILRPERRLRRPRGPLPDGAVLVDRHPETMLDRVLRPASTGVLHVSTAVRRLQHGRLQSYIVYLVAGIAVLALMVLLGGSQ
ncbi:MAG: NADH-quinone oxidoreductase subunit H [Opitutaceae bacterium]|nr:NADH-quinone oxidoreductase subunit H [Opitutaceae bacterium]